MHIAHNFPRYELIYIKLISIIKNIIMIYILIYCLLRYRQKISFRGLDKMMPRYIKSLEEKICLRV